MNPVDGKQHSKKDWNAPKMILMDGKETSGGTYIRSWAVESNHSFFTILSGNHS
jgi:hypothetical protein